MNKIEVQVSRGAADGSYGPRVAVHIHQRRLAQVWLYKTTSKATVQLSTTSVLLNKEQECTSPTSNAYRSAAAAIMQWLGRWTCPCQLGFNSCSYPNESLLAAARAAGQICSCSPVKSHLVTHIRATDCLFVCLLGV